MSEGIEQRAGDAVIICGGHGAYYATDRDERPRFGTPSGVHASCVEFLAGTDAAVLMWAWQDAPTDQHELANPLPIDHRLHVHNVILP